MAHVLKAAHRFQKLSNEWREILMNITVYCLSQFMFWISTHFATHTRRKKNSHSHTATNKRKYGLHRNNSPNSYSVKIWMMRICGKIYRAKKQPKTPKQTERRKTEHNKNESLKFRMQICNCIFFKCLRALVGSKTFFSVFQ